MFIKAYKFCEITGQCLDLSRVKEKHFCLDLSRVKEKLLLANRRRKKPDFGLYLTAFQNVLRHVLLIVVKKNTLYTYPKTSMENSSKETFLQLPPRYCLHHECAFFLKSKEISFETFAMRKSVLDLLFDVTLHYPPLPGTTYVATIIRASANCSFSFSLFQNGGYLRTKVLQIHRLPSPLPMKL